jgi:hypothetical protein
MQRREAKIDPRDREYPWRPTKAGVRTQKLPARAGYFYSKALCAAWEDWVVEIVGLELETHHPVIEPVSASPRERKFPMQRQAAKHALLPARDRS